MGEEASDEAELGNREWPRNENVGVVGDGTSVDDVDDVERCRPQPIGTVSDESISVCSFLRASTNNGNFNGLNSRILEKGRIDEFAAIRKIRSCCDRWK